MTTATCTCGADQFEGAKHVDDCPMGRAVSCDCGAIRFEGAKHEITCPMASVSYQPPQGQQPPQTPHRGASGARWKTPAGAAATS